MPNPITKAKNKAIQNALHAGRFKPYGKKKLTFWLFFEFDHDFTPWVNPEQIKLIHEPILDRLKREADRTNRFWPLSAYGKTQLETSNAIWDLRPN